MLVTPHLKSVLKNYQHSATLSLHGPGLALPPPPPTSTATSPGYLCGGGGGCASSSGDEAPSTSSVSSSTGGSGGNPITGGAVGTTSRRSVHQQLPILTAPDTASSDLCESVLEGETIACFVVGGEKRLCLPQVLRSVLRDFSLAQINHQCDSLLIYCSRCTHEQLDVLKGEGVLPASAFSCGLITHTDAERLCSALLHAANAPRNTAANKLSSSSSSAAVVASPPPPPPTTTSTTPSGGGSPPTKPVVFGVQHECFGGARGRCHPARYTSKHAKCIECAECMAWLTPQQFVRHVHRNGEHRTVHWGFDSGRWRRYLLPIECCQNGGGVKEPTDATIAGAVVDANQPTGTAVDGVCAGRLDGGTISHYHTLFNNCLDMMRDKYEGKVPFVDPTPTTVAATAASESRKSSGAPDGAGGGMASWNMSLKRKLLQQVAGNGTSASPPSIVPPLLAAAKKTKYAADEFGLLMANCYLPAAAYLSPAVFQQFSLSSFATQYLPSTTSAGGTPFDGVTSKEEKLRRTIIENNRDLHEGRDFKAESKPPPLPLDCHVTTKLEECDDTKPLPQPFNNDTASSFTSEMRTSRTTDDTCTAVVVKEEIDDIEVPRSVCPPTPKKQRIFRHLYERQAQRMRGRSDADDEMCTGSGATLSSVAAAAASANETHESVFKSSPPASSVSAITLEERPLLKEFKEVEANNSPDSTVQLNADKRDELVRVERLLERPLDHDARQEVLTLFRRVLMANDTLTTQCRDLQAQLARSEHARSTSTPVDATSPPASLAEEAPCSNAADALSSSCVPSPPASESSLSFSASPGTTSLLELVTTDAVKPIADGETETPPPLSPPPLPPPPPPAVECTDVLHGDDSGEDGVRVETTIDDDDDDDDDVDVDERTREVTPPIAQNVVDTNSTSEGDNGLPATVPGRDGGGEHKISVITMMTAVAAAPDDDDAHSDNM